MEKVAQSGSARPTQSGLPATQSGLGRGSQTWGRGPDWVTRRFALGGQWAWAWQTAEEHEWFAIITSYDIIEDGSIFQGNL